MTDIRIITDGPVGEVFFMGAAASSMDCAYFMVAMKRLDDSPSAMAPADPSAEYYPAIVCMSKGKLTGQPWQSFAIGLSEPIHSKLEAQADGVLLVADGFLYSINIDTRVYDFAGIGGLDARDLLVADSQTPGYAWHTFATDPSKDDTAIAEHRQPRFHVWWINLLNCSFMDIPILGMKYDQISGSTDPTRCMLANNRAGIQLVLSTYNIRWLMRTSDNIPVVLAGDKEVWAATPEGFQAISEDSLIDLAPKLAAPQAVPEEYAAELEAACSALGWEWDYVQVSPFTIQHERLLLFDCSNLSTSDEMEWNLVDHRADFVSVFSDLSNESRQRLQELDEEEFDQYYNDLLATLGWPDAEKCRSRSDDYPFYEWSLEPMIGDETNGGSCLIRVTENMCSIILLTDGFLERSYAQDDLPGMDPLSPPLTTAAR